MDRFDRFIKHALREPYYICYADDFVIFSGDKKRAWSRIPQIDLFLKESLNLHLHSHKVFVKPLGSGVDFLGWVHFPDHRVLRTATKRRMFNRVKTRATQETLNSYRGLLCHGNTRKLEDKLFQLR